MYLKAEEVVQHLCGWNDMYLEPSNDYDRWTRSCKDYWGLWCHLSIFNLIKLLKESVGSCGHWKEICGSLLDTYEDMIAHIQQFCSSSWQTCDQVEKSLTEFWLILTRVGFLGKIEKNRESVCHEFTRMLVSLLQRSIF